MSLLEQTQQKVNEWFVNRARKANNFIQMSLICNVYLESSTILTQGIQNDRRSNQRGTGVRSQDLF